MTWRFVVFVEDTHGFASTASVRELATRMLHQLRGKPPLLELTAGVAYKPEGPRLIPAARVAGRVEAANEHEAESIVRRSLANALPAAGDRKPTCFIWPEEKV